MRRVIKGFLAVVVLVLAGSLIWEPLAADEHAAPPPLTHDARIVRDEFGVPHIFGKTDADTAYGLAYAHSEDDFQTIEEVMAMTRGRYGALVGSKGSKVDYVLHLTRARETAAREYPNLPADVRAMLEAYARGVNLYAARHPKEVRLRKLFPVNGEDIATGFALRSPFFFGLDDTIGALAKGEKPPRGTAAPMTPIGPDPSMNGSNAFAVSPKKMADGKTWLISNAHQPYEGQVAFYEAAMHSGEGLDMVGALFPGMPFIAFGHNRDLGWTNTVNGPDLADVYKLVLNGDEAQYRLDGKWLPLESKRIWLPVRFGPFTVPVPRTVHYAPTHGPVITSKSGSFAIRYAGIGQIRMIEQFYRLQLSLCRQERADRLCLQRAFPAATTGL
jgi:acyl-homoserine-lactone acylase